ncbi:MAG TPA: hypothetical protein VGG74_19780 [Kofleriaceae bacterium]|jgi:hypothetical protein
MARTFAAIPSVVLVICLFLPALRVCGDPTTPITCPPVYAPYFGALGIALVALVRRGGLVKLGAAFTVVLDVVTVGGIGALVVEDAHSLLWIPVACATLAAVFVAVSSIVRATPSDRALATIAIVHGVATTIWATVLAFDPDGMWGAHVTLFAALALTVTSIVWLREHADEPPLPPAIVR